MHDRDNEYEVSGTFDRKKPGEIAMMPDNGSGSMVYGGWIKPGTLRVVLDVNGGGYEEEFKIVVPGDFRVYFTPNKD